MMRVKIVQKKIPPDLEAKMEQRVQDVVYDTAVEVREIAKQLAPKRTGFMADSIRIANSIAVEELRVVVGADYARFVEFGTRFQASQPFLRPAINSVKGRLRRRLGQIRAGLAKDIGTSTVVQRR